LEVDIITLPAFCFNVSCKEAAALNLSNGSIWALKEVIKSIKKMNVSVLLVERKMIVILFALLICFMILVLILCRRIYRSWAFLVFERA
jgi:hypothetical protein